MIDRRGAKPHLDGIKTNNAVTNLEWTTACPLCGAIAIHQHSGPEILIYRNGVKYGRSLAAPAVQPIPREPTDEMIARMLAAITSGGWDRWHPGSENLVKLWRAGHDAFTNEQPKP